MPARPRALALLSAAAVALAAGPAGAGGLELDAVGGRAVSRAGAQVVSADGGAALLVNPAGLVRRTGTRLQLETALHDHDHTFRTADDRPLDPCDPDSPRPPAGPSPISERGGAIATPALGFQTGLGERVVVGVAYLEPGRLENRMPRLLTPFDASLLATSDRDFARILPHRYGGLSFRYRRRALAAGAAVRVLDWLGVGASVSASRVELAEERHIWAGFESRGDRVGNMTGDLVLAVEGRAPMVPGAAAGLLVAPPSLPLELALSASALASAALEGDAALSPLHNGAHPAPIQDAPRSAAALPARLTARAGLRYLGPRFSLEAAAELARFPGGGDRPAWALAGVAVEDISGRIDPLTEVPSAAAQRNHAAARGAIEVEVVPTFLWLVGGYGFRRAAMARAELSPARVDLATHTVAVGAEGYWRDLTFTLGYSRSFSRPARVSAADSDVVIANPFGASAGTGPAGAGRYDRNVDSVGLAVEVAWE